MHPDIERLVVDEETIQRRVRELGEEISRDYAGESILLVVVLRGAALFLADLARQITVPMEIDFIT